MRARRVFLGAVSLVGLCAWCGWASGFHQSTTPAFATWAASLAGVVVVDLLLRAGRQGRRLAPAPPPPAAPWPRPGRGGGRRTLEGIAPWIVLVLVTAAWEALGIDTGAHQPHLTVSALAQAYRAFDAALLLVWIVVGVGYGVARARQVTAAPAGTAPGDAPAERHGDEPGEHARSEPEQRGRPSVIAITTGHQALGPALLLPRSKVAGLAFWAALLAAGVLVEMTARRSGGRLATAGELVRLLTRSTAVAVVLVGAWAYAGWHLFAH